MTRRRGLYALLLAMFAVAAQAAAAAGAPVRVLVVTGGHDYDPSFHSVTENVADLKVTVDPHPNAYSRDLRDRYDVIVFYDMVQNIPDNQRRNLLAFAESGKGLVVLHHALCSYETQDWWFAITGGQYFTKTSMYHHDQDFTAKRVREHPVTEGLPGQWKVHDETYKAMAFAPGNSVLVSTDAATADGPLAWVSSYDKSRVVAIQTGHNRESHLDTNYRKLVQNAIFWAAGRTGTTRSLR